jgi:hypothetical protein
MEVADDGLEDRLRRLLPGGRPTVPNGSFVSKSARKP